MGTRTRCDGHSSRSTAPQCTRLDKPLPLEEFCGGAVAVLLARHHPGAQKGLVDGGELEDDVLEGCQRLGVESMASRSKSLRERFALIRLFSTDWSFALMAFGASFLPFGGGFGCVSWRFGGGFGSSAGAAGACVGARDPLPSRDGGGSTGHGRCLCNEGSRS